MYAPEFRDKFATLAAPLLALLVLLGICLSGTAQADETVAPDMGPSSQNDAFNNVNTSPEPYTDTYLLADDVLDEIDYQSERDDALVGRRYFSTELIVYRSDNNLFGSEEEQGVRLRWRRETIRYGELDLELSLSGLDRNSTFNENNSTEALLTLRQSNAPISDEWLMSNTIGYQRTGTGGQIGGGYRIRLPSSPMLGLSSEWQSENRQLSLFTGRSGRAEGIALNQFDSDGGVLSGASVQHRFSPAWSATGKIIAFSGNDTTSRHTTMLAATRYLSDDLARSIDVSVLLDDNSDFGIWADAEHALKNDIQLRYGAYSLGTDLAWMDRLIVNDEVGAYFRADTRSYVYNMSAGYDYARTGNEAFGPMDTEVHNLYFNGNFRFTRNLNIGTSATYLTRQFDGLGGEQQTWRLNNYAFYKSWFGSSRLELYLDRVDGALSASTRKSRGLRLSHQWRMPQSLRLTTQIGLEENDSDGSSDNLVEANVMFRQDLDQSFSWGINASLYRGSGLLARSQDGLGVNADFRWAFKQNWYVSAVLNRNTTQFGDPSDLPVPGDSIENETTGDSFWLTLSYGKSSGRPVRILGNGDGIGSGRIEGVVFYDENGDFIQQPDERPAVGAVVLLDGRYEARTDALGRYEFDPVYTGSHWVSIDTSNLPLPWGLLDEAPHVVNVSLRRAGETNFALTRLN